MSRVKWAPWRMTAAALVLAGCATAAPPQAIPDLVWPVPPEAPRIKYIGSYWHSDQFGKQERGWLKDVVLGPDGSLSEQMVKPFAVTTDQKGRVYVTDTGHGRVWVFDKEKKQVRSLGDGGSARLVTPSGVAVDARGVVFVSDTKLDRVLGYDETGKIVLAIGEAGELASPAGIAIDQRSNRLFVADAGRHKIRVYDTMSGKFVFEFGVRGTEVGEFNFPTHLAIRGGELFVTDTMNFRVQVFALDGVYRRKYGEMGANFGQLARPKGVAVDSDGNVYVVDAAFGNFQIFQRDGDLLLFVGRVGPEPGEFFLPAGMHIDEQDRIYVVDQYNRRVQMFQYLRQADRVTSGKTR